MQGSREVEKIKRNQKFNHRTDEEDYYDRLRKKQKEREMRRNKRSDEEDDE